MSAQFIEQDGGDRFAVIPERDYQTLLEKAAMLDDVAAYDRAKIDLISGADELAPSAVADALLNGDNPVRVWRQFRGYSQTQLAEMAGISQAYLAQMETGKREGKISVYRSLADALRVDLDDLVE